MMITIMLIGISQNLVILIISINLVLTVDRGLTSKIIVR